MTVPHIFEEPQFGQNWFTYAGFYKQLIRNAPRGAVIVEVGSWKGKSTAFLAVEAINANKNISIYAVDLWLGLDDPAYLADHDVKAGTLYARFLDNMKPLRSVVTPLRMPSLDASRLFQDGAVDAVYIDASHKYEDVRADIAAWLPKVKPGGVLAGHDIHIPDVGRAVLEAKLPGIGYNSTEDIWVHCKPT